MAKLPTWETPPESVVETLERVRELLSDRKRWTKGGYAKNARGRVVEYDDPNAVKFCMIGAVYHVDGEFERTAERVLGYMVEAERPKLGTIPAFNDSSKVKHADVLALLDKAIEREKNRGGRSYDQGAT